MARGISVVPADSGKNLSRFIDFQYDLYRDSEYFVPPLRMDVGKVLNPGKNAFFEHGKIQPLIAVDANDVVVGRIAAIRNGMHLQTHSDATGFFGFFECVEDPDVATALLTAVDEWHVDNGLRAVRGPTNPTINDTSGLLVDGFDRCPSILMPYNKPYYEEYLLNHGYERAMTMWAYYVHKKYVETERLERGVKVVKHRNPNITIRTMDMSRFNEDAAEVLEIFNEAWSENWGHVPMTDNEFKQLAAEMKQVLDPGLVLILEDDGVPFAFSITLPNLNEALIKVKNGRLLPLGLPKILFQAKVVGIRECRTALMGIRPSYRGRGLDALLNLATIENGQRLGYSGCEMSWVLDTNPRLLSALKQLNAVVDKEYAMFEKALN
ncbi:MAG: hypothetical protein HKN43_09805 [Rhodothermales bacterium]|nr:hypothetical protein [Rhodothermales bacterium]